MDDSMRVTATTASTTRTSSRNMSRACASEMRISDSSSRIVVRAMLRMSACRCIW